MNFIHILIFLFAFFCHTTALNAQKYYYKYTIYGGYDWSQSGRDVSMAYMHQFNANHAWYAGLKYHNNSAIIEDNQNYKYKNRYQAYTQSEHWGLILGYNYFFNFKSDEIKPFAFYENRLSHISHRSDNIIVYDTLRDGTIRYTTNPTRSSPHVVMEQYVGVGCQAQFATHWFFFYKIGTGFLTDFGKETKGWSSLALHQNVGFAYKFEAIKIKRRKR